MNVRPIAIRKVDPSIIEIQWDNGSIQQFSTRSLRDRCPCATCREKATNISTAADPRAPLPVLSRAETQPLVILSMQPIGNYAYNIAFSDGHDSGIYTLDYLFELGQALPEKPNSERHDVPQ
ncbi:MAG: DUF971 domain-containing protein [Planctomycetales bacterium]|nr:DUF971 domain-containing protein [Planctomycetales bacterium]